MTFVNEFFMQGTGIRGATTAAPYHSAERYRGDGGVIGGALDRDVALRNDVVSWAVGKFVRMALLYVFDVERSWPAAQTTWLSAQRTTTRFSRFTAQARRHGQLVHRHNPRARAFLVLARSRLPGGVQCFDRTDRAVPRALFGQHFCARQRHLPLRLIRIPRRLRTHPEPAAHRQRARRPLLHLPATARANRHP